MPEAPPVQSVQSAGLYSDPLFLIFVCAIIFVVIYLAVGKGRFKKEYKTKPLAELNEHELKKRIGIQGIKINRFLKPAFLHIGFHKIASIDKYLIIQGMFEPLIWDSKNGEFKQSKEEKKVPYKLIMVRAKNKSLFWRMLGMKKEYYILNFENERIDIDHNQRRIFLPDKTDIRSYGGVWVNSNSSLSYIEDMSLGRMLASAQAEWESFPTRLIFLEMQTARRTQLTKTESTAEKNKYENRKDVGDTTVT
jgi:hypothetical protein